MISRRLISFQLICLTFGLLLATTDSIQSIEVHALTVFKQGLLGYPSRILSNWNALNSDPCNWVGVSCLDLHVTKLNISSCSIKGSIAKELFLLSFLRELILHGNNLTGPIPKEIGLLQNLKVLDLGENQLSGPIPHEIGNLVSIVKINLQSNALTGNLPSELGNLKNLLELRLDRNKLQGTIPGANATEVASAISGLYASNTNALGFCHASPLKVADFSFNYLVGSVPKCLEYLPRDSFQGNCMKYKDITQRAAEQCGVASPAKPVKSEDIEHLPAEKPGPSASKPTWILAVGVVTGVILMSIFLVALLKAVHSWEVKSPVVVTSKKSETEKEHVEIFIDTDMLKNMMRYSQQELEIACENFRNIIGSSSDSVVYKGRMKDGTGVAVVSLCNQEEHWTSYLELFFQKEVADLARLDHENIGKLLGYCIEGVPFTRKEGCQLSWTQRMTIVIGIAKGLKYLHTEIEPPFTISELESSSVYLTEDFTPKLVDFKSWKTIFTQSKNNSCSISNESAMRVARHVDIEGNIYALGVLLLEIISGRPPICRDKESMVDWAKEYVEEPEKIASLVDPAVKSFRNEDLEVIWEVVTICIQIKNKDKVTMQELCAMLETIGLSETKVSPLALAELPPSS